MQAHSEEPNCWNPWGGVRQKTKREAEEEALDHANYADLAKEMNELSVAERERVLDDLHGVAVAQEETPEFVDKCIRAFNLALSKLPPEAKKNLNQAFFLRPKLETGKDFKLKFLRADEYNATNAVRRMIKFFDLKCELFGEEKLGKRIEISDLSEADLYTFTSGYVVELPTCDQTGRPIVFADSSKADFEHMTPDNLLRAIFYLHSEATETEIAQKKGACCLTFCPGNGLSLPGWFGRATEYVLRSGSLVSAMPMRYTSFHFCYPDPQMEFLIRTVRVALGKTAGLRFRAHYGSDIENEYKLLTFGIASDRLLQNAAAGDTSIHQEYIQRRRESDRIHQDLEAEEEKQTGLVAYPKKNDILIGRGHAYRDYRGNTLWNQLINEHLNRYTGSENSFDKTCITMEVVRKIREQNGRFLQRTREGWKVLDDICAREKVATTFRNRAKASAVPSICSKASLSSREGDFVAVNEHGTKRIRKLL